MNAPKPPPTLLSAPLAKAFAHPIRVQAMAILTERIASPMEAASPKELADEIGQPLNLVSYHLKILKDLGCVELQGMDAARGGRVVEHFYRATQRPYIDAEAWEQLSDHEKNGAVGTIVRLMSEDLAAAMERGTFNDPDDNHLSRTPLTVDQEGWCETVSILDRAADELIEVQENSNLRLAKNESSDARMKTKVEILHFRSPDSR